MSAVVYPDAVDGQDRVSYAYNRQGQVIELTDQNGTVHAYDFDKLGRPVEDRVTALGAGIDGSVRRLETTYEVRGLIEHRTSYDNPTTGSGSVVNDVQNVYNDFGQLVSQYQSHSGAVMMGTTPRVQYSYASGAANTIRATSVAYPDGRVLSFDYGSAGGDDDHLSRVESLDDAGPSERAAYTYLGLASIVEVDYPEPEVRYDLITGTGANPYAGLDRFGRIIDLLWRDYGASADAERLEYGYDRNSNRTYRENTVAPSGAVKRLPNLSTTSTQRYRSHCLPHPAA